MPLYVFILPAVAILAGAVLFLRGRRGRLIDAHPHCAHCGYDLFGQPKTSHLCPECGRNLDSSRSIRIGTRQRRAGLVVFGIVIILIGAVPLATMTYLAIRSIDPMHVKPVSWLLRAAASETAYSAEPNCNELLRRLKNGSIWSPNRKQVVEVALALQADREKPWNPIWGDMIELIHEKGQLSETDWQTYLSQDEFAVLEVRPNVALYDPIPFRIRAEFRGATPVPWRQDINAPTFFATIPRVPVQNAVGGETPDEVEGAVNIQAAAWDKVRPGPHAVTIAAPDLAAKSERHPDLFGPLALTGNWTLLPAGQPSATLYRDEALAARIEKILSCHVTSADFSYVSLRVDANACPADLAFEVILKSGSIQSDAEWILLRKTGGSFNWATFTNVQGLVGKRGDIILRPSTAVAAQWSVDMVKVLDHEFVFKNVLFDDNYFPTSKPQIHQ